MKCALCGRQVRDGQGVVARAPFFNWCLDCFNMAKALPDEEEYEEHGPWGTPFGWKERSFDSEWDEPDTEEDEE